MKSYLAENLQLFNAKTIAYATTREDLAEGEIGFFAEGSDTSIAATVDTFAELPDRFNIVSKVGGKTYYSFDTIDKSRISRIVQKDYQAEVVNEWETTITYCDCIEGFNLQINIDEQSLIQRDGMTWTHRDFVVGVAAEEIDCQCKDGVLGGRDNNVITKMLVEKVNAMNSPFYEAEARAASDDSVVADIDAFIATNKAVNEDGDTATDVLLKFVLKGKAQPADSFRDLEVNYVSPRGVKMAPAISVNEGEKSYAFTENVQLQYEIGAGADMRHLEWCNMNYYTDLNYYTRLSDGIASKGLVYQFENGVNYDTLSFEFYTDKVETNNGDKRLFGVMIGAAEGSAASASIEALFTT